MSRPRDLRELTRECGSWLDAVHAIGREPGWLDPEEPDELRFDRDEDTDESEDTDGDD